MKKIGITLITITSILFTGCHFLRTGSGKIVTKELGNTNFSSVQVNGECHLEIIQAKEYSITIDCDDNIMGDLKVDQNGETLKISLNDFAYYKSITFKVVIKMPDLRDFKMSGSSNLIVKEFNSDHTLNGEMSGSSNANINFNTKKNMQLKLSGSSDLIMKGKCKGLNIYLSGSSGAKINYDIVENSTIRTKGSSDITMSGNCKNLFLKTSGSSDAKLSKLFGQNATINLSGSGNASVRLNGTLIYDLSGSSSLISYGNITSISKQKASSSSSYTHTGTKYYKNVSARLVKQRNGK